MVKHAMPINERMAARMVPKRLSWRAVFMFWSPKLAKALRGFRLDRTKVQCRRGSHNTH